MINYEEEILYIIDLEDLSRIDIEQRFCNQLKARHAFQRLLEAGSIFINTALEVERSSPEVQRDPIEKSLLGIMPDWCWKEERVVGLLEASQRFVGHNHGQVRKWLNEVLELLPEGPNKEVDKVGR